MPPEVERFLHMSLLGTALGSRVRRKKEGSQLTKSMWFQPWQLFPSHLMLSAFFAASTQPFCPLDKFSAEVIQVNAARMALGLGTTEPKSRMWPMLTILGTWAALFYNLEKSSSSCLSFCLLSSPNWNSGGILQIRKFGQTWLCAYLT